MRAGLIVLGIALGILWIAGLSAHATGWLVWLDFVVAVLSIATAAAPESVPNMLKASPFGYGVALLVFWIIALATHASYWMSWWTFGFGIAYLLFGLAVSWPEQRIGRPRQIYTGPTQRDYVPVDRRG